MSEPTKPPIKSLGDFHVSASTKGPDAIEVDSDVIEVRFVLTDKDEARAWAVWLFERQEANEGRREHAT